MTCTLDDAIDVSRLQEVPDNQEVFAFANTRACLIIELLEMLPDKSGDEAARHFFADICQANGGEESSVVEFIEPLSPEVAPNLAAAFPKQALVGRHVVAKARRTDVVRVVLAHVRLPEVTTDLLISVSAPVAEGDAEEDVPDFPANAFSEPEIGETIPEVAKLLQVLRTFQVVDWSLFA